MVKDRADRRVPGCLQTVVMRQAVFANDLIAIKKGAGAHGTSPLFFRSADQKL